MSLTKIKIWTLAVRPKTLPAAIAPVLIGCALAFGEDLFFFPAAATAMFCAIMIQIGTNLANDYIDFRKGSDQPDRLGPTRVTSAGLVSPVAIKRAIIITFGLSLAGGIYLVARGGWPILVIGLGSILFGLLYSAGPWSLSQTGSADLFVLVFFGPVAVAGTHYVQTLEFSSSALLAGIPPGLISVAILTINNLRDIESDKRANKKTLAVRFGPTLAKIEFSTCLMLACLWPLLFLYGDNRHPWTIIASLAIIPGLFLINQALTLTGRELNNVLASTGKLLVLFALLFSLGWLV